MLIFRNTEHISVKSVILKPSFVSQTSFTPYLSSTAEILFYMTFLWKLISSKRLILQEIGRLLA
jgi:hypothetical protein